jgi:hypothetical protein
LVLEREPSSKLDQELKVTTKTTNVKQYGWIRYYVYDGVNPVSTSFVQPASPSFTNNLTKDGPVRDYKHLIALGRFAGSSLVWDGIDFSANPTYAKGSFGYLAHNPSLSNTWRSAQGNPLTSFNVGDPGAPSTSVANTSALTSLSKRLANELTTFQGGVFVGELKETIHLIRHPLLALRQGLSRHLDLVAKRARRIRKISNMKRMVAETWLETSFGMKPLLSDIDNAADAMAQFIVDPTKQEFKTLTAQGFHETANDAELSNFGMTSFSWYDVRVRSIRKRTATVKYLACIGVSPSVRSSALQKVGLNFASFIPTMWELIPYSFVVDYFTNVGDIIQGLANCTADVRWVMKWIITEDREEAKNFYLVPTWDPQYPPLQEFRSGNFIASKKTIVRSQYLGSLIPPFRWEIPGEGSLKWANLAALGVQLSSTRRIVQQPARNKLHLLRKGTF